MTCLLHGLSDLLSRYTRLPDGWSLVLVVLALVAVLGLGGWFLGTQVASEMTDLARSLAESGKQWQHRLEQSETGKQIVALSSVKELARGRIDWLGRTTGIFSTTLIAVTSFVIIVFIGLYIAANSGLYRRGMIKLVPPRGRKRAGEVLDARDAALRGWLTGQAFSMAVVGVSTTIGLWLLGVPLALALVSIACLMAFVPYLGPILLAVPAVLVAFTLGPSDVLYVGLLYLGVEAVESYLLTPLIQQRIVHLPPALTVAAQMPRPNRISIHTARMTAVG